MTKIEKRFIVESGMTLEDVFKNGSNQQKKIACVFDYNSDGKFDEKEAKLFNATSTREDADGNITFWTRMSNGKKIKNVIEKDDLQSTVLVLEKCNFTTREQKNGKLYTVHHKGEQVSNYQRELSGETYFPSECDGMKLVSKNPLNGQTRYESEIEKYPRLDGQGTIKANNYVVTDRYGRIIEKCTVNTTGESDYFDGKTVYNYKDNTETHYDYKNKKLGSIQHLGNNKEKVTDAKGKILYYVQKQDNGSKLYFDANNKPLYKVWQENSADIDRDYYNNRVSYCAEIYNKDGKVVKKGKYFPDMQSSFSHEDIFTEQVIPKIIN